MFDQHNELVEWIEVVYVERVAIVWTMQKRASSKLDCRPVE